jgi:hypothetical protein
LQDRYADSFCFLLLSERITTYSQLNNLHLIDIWTRHRQVSGELSIVIRSLFVLMEEP